MSNTSTSAKIEQHKCYFAECYQTDCSGEISSDCDFCDEFWSCEAHSDEYRERTESDEDFRDCWHCSRMTYHYTRCKNQVDNIKVCPSSGELETCRECKEKYHMYCECNDKSEENLINALAEQSEKKDKKHSCDYGPYEIGNETACRGDISSGCDHCDDFWCCKVHMEAHCEKNEEGDGAECEHCNSQTLHNNECQSIDWCSTCGISLCRDCDEKHHSNCRGCGRFNCDHQKCEDCDEKLCEKPWAGVEDWGDYYTKCDTCIHKWECDECTDYTENGNILAKCDMCKVLICSKVSLVICEHCDLASCENCAEKYHKECTSLMRDEQDELRNELVGSDCEDCGRKMWEKCWIMSKDAENEGFYCESCSHKWDCNYCGQLSIWQLQSLRLMQRKFKANRLKKINSILLYNPKLYNDVNGIILKYIK